MPTPKKGESMEDYMKRFMGSEEAKKDYPDEKQRYAVGMSKWKNMKHFETELKLNYNIPLICESEIKEGMDFMIAGIAINATTTSNNHRFLTEELINAASSLNGRPLLVDHKNEVDSIKGRVTFSGFNEISNRIDFKAKVVDNKIKQMIKDGLINSVSVGATVKEMEESEGFLIPRGIEFKELSLVAVPADANATFNIALKEAYEILEQGMEKCKECGKMIPKDKMKDHMAKHKEEMKDNTQLDNEIVEDNIQCKEVKMSEEKIEAKAEIAKTAIVENKDISDMRALILKMQLELEELKKTKAKKEEKIEKIEKADVQVESIDEKSKYNIVQSYGSIRGGAFTLVR